MSSKIKLIEEELEKKKKLFSNKSLISKLPDKGEKIKKQIESLEGLLKIEKIKTKQKEEETIDTTIDYLKQLKIEEHEKRKREEEITDQEVEELMKKMKKTSISKDVEKKNAKQIIPLSHEESIKYAKLNKEKMMKANYSFSDQKFEPEEESKPLSSLILEDEIFE
eukprot:gene820-9070_t